MVGFHGWVLGLSCCANATIGAATKIATATKSLSIVDCRSLIDDWKFFDLASDIPPSKLHPITCLRPLGGDPFVGGLTFNHGAMKDDFLTAQSAIDANHREWFHFHSVGPPRSLKRPRTGAAANPIY